MTAVAEAPAAVEAIKPRFFPVQLEASDPLVRNRLAAFFARYNLPRDTIPKAIHWWGISDGETVHVVVGTAHRLDGSIEVTDYYPLPTKLGVEAGYFGLRALKALVDTKRVPYVVCAILWRNRFGQKHFERVFGGSPRCVVYAYDGDG